MGSWRERASATAQADLDRLVRAVLPLAERTLGKHGELLPYAATVDLEDEESLAAADPAVDSELPTSHDVLALLYEAARNSADALRAVAFVAAVRVVEGDAIRVELEHREGVAITLVIPYERVAAAETITLGPIRATPGTMRTWHPSAPPSAHH